MANNKSAKKRIRTNERRHLRNTMYRSRVKTLIKRAEKAIYDENSSSEERNAHIREAVRTIDKAINKGILHRNNGARRKSRLMKKFNQVTRPSA